LRLSHSLIECTSAVIKINHPKNDIVENIYTGADATTKQKK
jgi:hypothetical protein